MSLKSQSKNCFSSNCSAGFSERTRQIIEHCVFTSKKSHRIPVNIVHWSFGDEDKPILHLKIIPYRAVNTARLGYKNQSFNIA